MATVRVIIWDEINLLQRISTPEDTFLIEAIDASGSDDNMLMIGPVIASGVMIGHDNIATFVSGVLSGNFITGTFYGDGSQLRGVVHQINSLTGSFNFIGGPNVDITTDNSVFPTQIVVSASVSASGIDPVAHRGLDQLVHDIAETSFLEINRSGSSLCRNKTKVTGAIYWTDSDKTLKIREEQFNYFTNGKISSSILIQYDTTGSMAERLTTTYAYECRRIISQSSSLEIF